MGAWYLLTVIFGKLRFQKSTGLQGRISFAVEQACRGYALTRIREKTERNLDKKTIDYGNDKRTYNSVLQRPQFQTPRGRFRRLYSSVQQISIENHTPVYRRI